jgi:hypothetical protein
MEETGNVSNYVYLLQEREFIKTKEPIYKVGMTTKTNLSRIKSYPKGSILLFYSICNNCKTMENNLIELFKSNFIHRKDIGSEYFEGNYKDMIHFFYQTLFNENLDTELNYINNKLYIKNQFETFIKKFNKIFTYNVCNGNLHKYDTNNDSFISIKKEDYLNELKYVEEVIYDDLKEFNIIQDYINDKLEEFIIEKQEQTNVINSYIIKQIKILFNINNDIILDIAVDMEDEI